MGHVIYVSPAKGTKDRENVDTACTARNERSEEVLFDLDIVTKTKHLDDEMRSSTRENGK